MGVTQLEGKSLGQFATGAVQHTEPEMVGSHTEQPTTGSASVMTMERKNCPFASGD